MTIAEEVKQAFSQATQGKIFNIRINLAQIGSLLGGKAFIQKHGENNLRSLLEKLYPALILEEDHSHKIPVVYATLVSEPKDPNNNEHIVLKQNTKEQSIKKYQTILDFAYMPHIKYEELAKMAIPEDWTLHRNKQTIELGMLKIYINHTFLRLLHENKVLIKHNKDTPYAAFNTGLVDNRYLPIYALFDPNPNQKQPWQLKCFCIAGEDYGKMLVKEFSPLPERAEYITDPKDIFYNYHSGKPYIDYDHIIIENAERLPFSFFKRLQFDEFTCKDCSSMNPEELENYKNDLKYTLKFKDCDSYNIAKMHFDSALEEALNRVRWNYKTAIPMYYPRTKTVSLLFPLRLDKRSDSVDVALVVERQSSGAYIGHTILTLEMAYQNARLICRPDSDWLSIVSSRIASS